MQPSELGQLDWIYRNGETLSRTDNDDGSVTLSLMVTKMAREEIEAKLTRKRG